MVPPPDQPDISPSADRKDLNRLSSASRASTGSSTTSTRRPFGLSQLWAKKRSAGGASSVQPQGFTTLYEAKKPSADVIFIHGLQGKPDGTWTKKIQSSQNNVEYVFWPRDLLPIELKESRILTYGYDTKILSVFRTSNQNDIVAHARNFLQATVNIRREAGEQDRPLVFVAHSLGGLIVKEALWKSKHSEKHPHLQTVFNATRGVVFLGTPHRGSAAAGWGDLAANLATVVGQTPNRKILQQLNPDHDLLEKISNEFRILMNQGTFKVYSFYEERGISGVRGFDGRVVPPKSAIIEDFDGSVEEKSGINADHREMCRFSGVSDPGFVAVSGVIRRYVRLPLHVSPAVVRKSYESFEKTKIIRKGTFQLADPKQIDQKLVEQRSRPEKDASNEPKKTDRGDLVVQKDDKTVTSLDELTAEEIKILQGFRADDVDFESERLRLPRRHERTCEWVLDEDEYKDWREHPNSDLLWISGLPGMGKTILANFLVETLEKFMEIDNTSTVAYFFCNAKKPSFRTAEAIMRTVLYEILQADPGLVRTFVKSYWLAQGEKMYSSLSTLLKIFQTVAARAKRSRIFLVVDALDECESDRDTFLSFIAQYIKDARSSNQDQTTCKLKVILTSRPYQSIEDVLGSFGVIRMKTEASGLSQKINEDITSYITFHAKELAAKRGFDADEISRGLEAKVDGMFLWAALMVDILGKTPSHLVEAKLRETPRGMEGIYASILKEVPFVVSGGEVDQIVLWVSCSIRPLKVQELATILLFQRGNRNVGATEIQLEQTRSDLRLYYPLLKIQESDDTIQLVHHTAREFLLGLVKNVSDEAQVHYGLATTCMKYIATWSDTADHEISLNLRPGQTWAERLLEIQVDNPFLDYSCVNWPEHASKSAALQEELWPIFTENLHDNKDWLSVHDVQIISSKGLRYRRNVCSELHVFAQHGLEAFVIKWLEKSQESLDLPDLMGQTPLSRAVVSGKRDVVALLLNLQVNLELPDDRNQTSLFLAASNGQQGIAKMLIDKGANIEAYDVEEASPLSSAVFLGHIETVQVLLDAGADIRSRNLSGNTPLHHAATQGKMDILRAILRRASPEDANARNNSGATALLAATSVDVDIAIPRALIIAGADVNIKNDMDQPPLTEASDKGKTELVKLLLSKGADLSVQNQFDQTPLALAGYEGHLETCKLLLNAGMDVNVRAHLGASAVSYAAQKGYSEILRLLLEHGGDPNIRVDKGDTNRTPLHLAALSQDSASVVALLDNGADADLQDGQQNTPLALASYKGNIAAVRALLGRGAQIDNRDTYGQTPIFWPLTTLNIEVADLFLESGADINVVDNGGETLLSAAAGQSMEAISYVMSKRKAADFALDIKSKYGGKSLQKAISNGHLDVVAYLLSEGAPIDWTDQWGQTLLHSAAWAGSIKAMTYLVDEKGMDINVVDNDLDTPFFAAAKSAESSAQTLEWLLNNGASIEYKNKTEKTAFDMACENMNVAKLKFLLEKGAKATVDGLAVAAKEADVDLLKLILDQGISIEASLNDVGDTALLVVARNGSASAVRLLLDRGADLWARNKKFRTAFIVSVRSGISEIQNAEAMLERALAPAESPQCQLSLAAIRGDLGEVQRLASNNLDLNRNDDFFGFPPLHCAAAYNHIDVVEYLLNHGADVEVRNKHNECTPIFWAAANDSIPMLELFLSRGAALDVQANHGQSPLGVALVDNNSSAIKYLLSLNRESIGLEQRDVDGDTPLGIAADSNCIDGIKLLLAAGVAVNATNLADETPLDIAVRKSQDQAAYYLKKAGGLEKSERKKESAQENETVDSAQPDTAKETEQVGEIPSQPDAPDNQLVEAVAAATIVDQDPEVTIANTVNEAHE